MPTPPDSPAAEPLTARRAGHSMAAAVASLSIAQTRIAVILAGGAIGALARATLAEDITRSPDGWPWPTFIANLVGAFFLGWLTTRLAERTAPSRYWRLFLGTGFCGALTTFSTFQVETFQLIRDGYAGLAIAYCLASIVAGMVLVSGGVLIARWGRHW
jgi:fluoride exporter